MYKKKDRHDHNSRNIHLFLVLLVLLVILLILLVILLVLLVVLLVLLVLVVLLVLLVLLVLAFLLLGAFLFLLLSLLHALLDFFGFLLGNGEFFLLLGDLLGSLHREQLVDIGLLFLITADDTHGGLDDSDTDGLSHVTHSETSEGRVLVIRLNAHRLGGDDGHDGRVTSLDELRANFDELTRTSIVLELQLRKLASNVRGVAIQDRGVSLSDFTRVVHHDDLGLERIGGARRVSLGVTSNHTTLDILGGQRLDVKTNVVSGLSLLELFVVHFHRLDFGRDTGRGEDADHTRGERSGLDTADRYGTDTTDLVHILKRETEGLLRRTRRRSDVIELLLQGATLPPRHVVDLLAINVALTSDDHISGPTRDREERNQVLLAGSLEAFDLLVAKVINSLAVDGLTLIADVVGVEQDTLDFGLDFLESGLVVLDSIHLVDQDDDLFHTQSVGQQGVLTGGTVFRDTSFEVGSVDDEERNIGLGGTSDHVLDEILVSGGINDGEVELFSLELPQGDIDGDTSFTLSLELVKNPGVLEGGLTHFGGLLLKLFNLTLGDTTALVNQMTGSGRLSRVDVANDDQVHVDFFFSGHSVETGKEGGRRKRNRDME
jgi:hypothetical protein